MTIDGLSVTQASPVATSLAVHPASIPAAVLKSQTSTAKQVQIGKLLTLGSTRLDFNVDPLSREIVLKIVDSQSGDLLYQVPSDVAMNIAKWLDLSGHPLLDETA